MIVRAVVTGRRARSVTTMTISTAPITRVLFTGGARSGKSTAAESLAAGAPDVTYVATAPPLPDDPEWAARVAEHRVRRPAHWATVETDDICPPMAAATPDRPVLVDCLTLWLMARMDRHGAWTDEAAARPALEADIAAVVHQVAASRGGLILVTNEVGSGIVPDRPGTRLFRDLLGRTNAAVAAECDSVYLVVAGHHLRLRRELP